MKVKKLFIVLILLAGAITLHAQTNKLGGQLLSDENGNGFSGARVTLIHSKKTVITDGQGFFLFRSITLPDTLLITYIGYERMVRVLSEAREDYVFRLKAQNIALNDVVVNTGYQKIKAGRATGAFDVIDSSLFNRQVGTDIFRRLEGITPSLLYDHRGSEGGLLRFTIRGISSLNSSSNIPLIVLDNFPYTGDVSNINPNDVESITILKDAAASAVWGTRAGNGVIVITTKSAKYNSPLKFSLSANSTIGQKPDLFANPQIGSADFLQVEKYLYDKGFYTSILSNTRDRPVVSPYVELLEQQRLGQVSGTELAKQVGVWAQRDGRDDYNRYFQRNAVNQQYSLNFDGGGKQLNYVGSVGWDNNRSNAVGNGNKRLTLRNQFNMKPVPKLNIGAGFIYTQQRTASNGYASYTSLRPLGGRSNYYPYVDFVDEQGNALAVERDYRKKYIDTAGGGRLLDWSFRPLDEVLNGDNGSKSHDFLMNAQADYQVFDFLKASIQYRFQNTLGQAINNQSEDSYFTRNLINRYTQINGNTMVRPIPLGGIVDQQDSRSNAYDVRGQLDISKVWGRHQLRSIVGGEVREAANEASSYRLYGFDRLNYTTGNVDLVDRFPVYGNLSGTTNIPSYGGLSSQLDRNVSYYGNLDYSYGSKYDLSISARKDASNLFGVKANQKGVPLGSIGAAWHVGQEAFYHVDWLPELTLRTTYGITGNVNNSISALTTIRYDGIFLGINTFTGLPQATIVNPPNPDLKWESVKIFNSSVEFSSRNNRVSGTIAYYYKKSTDLITQIAVDATTGGSNIRTTNNAALSNQGLEVTMRSINTRGKFNWSTNFIYASSHSKVLKYYNDPISASTYATNGGGIIPIVGKPAYGILSFKSAGLDRSGDPTVLVGGVPSKDYNGFARSIVFDDLIFHGTTLPVNFGSIRNNFGYRHFELSFNISYKLDYFYRRSGLNYSALYNWIAVPEFNQRWQKPGDELITQVPGMTYPVNGARDAAYISSDILVEKGDHIKLQDLRIAYQLPKKWLNGLHLNRMDLFVIGNNLGVLWKASKYPYDPEYGPNYTPTKTFSFGIKTDF